MSSPFDETDFVDRDLQPGMATRAAAAVTSGVRSDSTNARPPTREELDARSGETQNKIAELRRAQEQLERERAALEEARRRRTEFELGRGEMSQHLTRGIGLLEKAEFDSRRNAEQMAKTLMEFREALATIQSINEQSWTQETWNTELTRALTILENARMEWNSAQLKWPILDSNSRLPEVAGGAQAQRSYVDSLAGKNPLELGKLGLALTWPLAAVAFLALTALIIVLIRR